MATGPTTPTPATIPAPAATPPTTPTTPTPGYFSSYMQGIYGAAIALGAVALTAIVLWGGYSVYNRGYHSGQIKAHQDIKNRPIVERLETFADESTIYLGIKRLDGTAEGAITKDGRVWRTYSGTKIEDEPKWDMKAKQYFEQKESKPKPEVLRAVPYPCQPPAAQPPAAQPPAAQPPQSTQPTFAPPQSGPSSYEPRNDYPPPAKTTSGSQNSDLETRADTANIVLVPISRPGR